MTVHSRSLSRPTNRKRFRLWHALVLVTMASLVSLLLWLAVRQRPVTLSETEKDVLSKLEKYQAKYELNEVKDKVVRIVLDGNRSVDEALEEVVRLPHLRRLSMNNSSVTDASLLKLYKCKRLQSIGLCNTSVSDRGLSYLARMPSLRNIYVTVNDKLTPGGIAAFQRSSPGVRVHVMNRAKR